MNYDDQHSWQDQDELSQIVTPPPAPTSLLQSLEFHIDQYKQYLSSSLLPEQLRQTLQHERWEVRCAAIERLGTQDQQRLPVDLLTHALSDESLYVRDAALRILERRGIQPLDYLPVQELENRSWLSFPLERKQAMASSQTDAENMVPLNRVGKLPHAARKKWFQRVRLLALAGILIVVLGALTAASFGFGWWDPLLGSPNLYTTINQQQTYQGVTIEITQVYADEGRTIVAYRAFSGNSTKQYYLNNFNLTGSAQQKQETLLATYGNTGSHFYYLVQSPFLVPANVQKLTLTLTIGHLIVVTTGQGSSPLVTGSWHFTFTVPFHHANNSDIRAPIPGNTEI